MKTLKTISFLIVLVFSSGCKKAVGKQELNNSKIEKSRIVKPENNLPYTSDSIKEYYKYNSDSMSYIVNTQYKGFIPGDFKEDTNHLIIKENDFEMSPSEGEKYYILQTFNFSNENICKLIIYNSLGENDSKILNVQLNSYLNDKLADQLLLDSRFTFEAEYYRDFKINNEKSIEIIKYSIDHLDYNEAGDILGEKKASDTNKIKVEYMIDSTGKFIKK